MLSYRNPFSLSAPSLRHARDGNQPRSLHPRSCQSHDRCRDRPEQRRIAGRPGAGTGTLTGNVTIGPLCPAGPCPLPHDRLVAAYAARPITISTPGGPVIASVIADPETGYTVALKPGKYIIDISHQGIGGSRELPETVTIRRGETVRLNITIDTGIR